jgi:hypothetical protein
VHNTSFPASGAILCPEKGIFHCRPVILNATNPHQELVVWIKMGFAQGVGLSRDRRRSIASATLPSSVKPDSSGQICCFVSPASGCFAARHGQAVTLHKAQYFGRLFLSSQHLFITWSTYAYGVDRMESLNGYLP